MESVREMAEMAVANKLLRIRSGQEAMDDGDPADCALDWETQAAASCIEPTSLLPTPNGCNQFHKAIYSVDGGVLRRGRLPPDDDVTAYGFLGRCITK